MRTIKLENWKIKVDEKTEVEENLLAIINVLLANKKPEELPRGLDSFRLFHRLTKAFDKADRDKILILEDSDYKFLSDMIKSDIPAIWGANPNVAKAIEEFLNLKED